MSVGGQFLQSILSIPEPQKTEVSNDGQYNDPVMLVAELKPIEVLKKEILPILLPCIHQLLIMIKENKEYEREKLNSINWMVEYLYKNNPKYKAQRGDVELLDIPFVQRILSERPQPPLPLHLRLTKGEAATIIQAGVRGYKDRQLDRVQGFRAKMKLKLSAALVIQSAWRGFKKRRSLTDNDLSNNPFCKLYYPPLPDEKEADEESSAPVAMATGGPPVAAKKS